MDHAGVKKELRIALVCFGGVSLAIYMHGISKEILKLLRASARLHGTDRAARQTFDFFDGLDNDEGEYDTAIPILWRIFQADRSNQDARSYLVRCYYNQGIAQLQNGLFPKAAESFAEVIAIDPEDVEAARHRKFADRYLKSDLDLMGRIYVRHVQQRP